MNYSYSRQVLRKPVATFDLPPLSMRLFPPSMEVKSRPRSGNELEITHQACQQPGGQVTWIDNRRFVLAVA